jgi:hypothetical protein
MIEQCAAVFATPLTHKLERCRTGRPVHTRQPTFMNEYDMTVDRPYVEHFALQQVAFVTGDDGSSRSHALVLHESANLPVAARLPHWTMVQCGRRVAASFTAPHGDYLILLIF